MPTPDMGFTPNQTKELLKIADKVIKGDKEAEADLMLQIPSEFMEKMDVKAPMSIANKVKDMYGPDGKKLPTTETPKAAKKLKSAQFKSRENPSIASQKKEKPKGTASATRKKSSGGNPKAKASGMGY